MNIAASHRRTRYDDRPGATASPRISVRKTRNRRHSNGGMAEAFGALIMFQSDNESNDEDYARSPVLLDLDENSKQQQKAARGREASSPNTASAVQDQRLQDQLTPSVPGGCWRKYVAK